MSHYYSVLLYCGAPVPGQPRGPSQFPAHNNGMNNKRRLLTGSSSGFTSPGTLRTTGGPNRNPNWMAALTYIGPKKMCGEDARSVGITPIIFFQRIPSL